MLNHAFAYSVSVWYNQTHFYVWVCACVYCADNKICTMLIISVQFTCAHHCMKMYVVLLVVAVAILVRTWSSKRSHHQCIWIDEYDKYECASHNPGMSKFIIIVSADSLCTYVQYSMAIGNLWNGSELFITLANS